jgi:hypothetical protein
MNPENPFKTYSVQFPYSVRFTLEDDPNTEVIINTKSEEFYYSRNEEDVLFERELSYSHSTYKWSKHILQELKDGLYYLDPRDTKLTFTGDPKIKEMTQEEIDSVIEEMESKGG